MQRVFVSNIAQIVGRSSTINRLFVKFVFQKFVLCLYNSCTLFKITKSIANDKQYIELKLIYIEVFILFKNISQHFEGLLSVFYNL